MPPDSSVRPTVDALPPEPIKSHWIWIFDGYLLVVMLTARVHISLYDILKSQ